MLEVFTIRSHRSYDGRDCAGTVETTYSSYEEAVGQISARLARADDDRIRYSIEKRYAKDGI